MNTIKDWDIISTPPQRYRLIYNMQFAGDPVKHFDYTICFSGKDVITEKFILEYLQEGWTEVPTITNLTFIKLIRS